MTRRFLPTATHLAMVAFFLMTALESSSCFVISPKRGAPSSLTHQSYQTTLPRGMNNNNVPATPIVLRVWNNDNYDSLQDNVKAFGKAAANVVGKAAKTAGKAALQGLREGIKGIGNVVQETKKNKQVQQGVNRLKTFVQDKQENSQVQEGLDRIKNLVQEAQEQFQQRQASLDNNNDSWMDKEENFDTEDEQLFRDIPKKRPEVVVHAEVVPGVRVVDGRAKNPIIDAEIISKTWSR